jgi:hypothetical protein
MVEQILGSCTNGLDCALMLICYSALIACFAMLAIVAWGKIK